MPILEVSYWNLLQIARNLLVMKTPLGKESGLRTIKSAFETGDLYEQQALFAETSGLPSK